ncbi:hypothetical protein FIBSPDRAFT_943027 [Athelia psychrophila]|uniref:Uncharacterized protein n=1 Tax=Athelia psychrophila TaxID=1759441 RepID=A0A166WN36_9AGAM|nr:hypothetical protein FIBSPDRAFT_943027 [Fibularhizoctonia sp. CBS 109695]
MSENCQPNQFTFDGDGGPRGNNNPSDVNFGPAQQVRAGPSFMDELMPGETEPFGNLASAPQPTVDWAALVHQVATFGEDLVFNNPNLNVFFLHEPPSDTPTNGPPLNPLMVDELLTDESVLDSALFTMLAPVDSAVIRHPSLTADVKAQRKVNACVNALRNKELGDSIREFEALKLQQVDTLSIKHTVPIT